MTHTQALNMVRRSVRCLTIGDVTISESVKTLTGDLFYCTIAEPGTIITIVE